MISRQGQGSLLSAEVLDESDGVEAAVEVDKLFAGDDELLPEGLLLG